MMPRAIQSLARSAALAAALLCMAGFAQAGSAWPPGESAPESASPLLADRPFEEPALMRFLSGQSEGLSAFAQAADLAAAETADLVATIAARETPAEAAATETPAVVASASTVADEPVAEAAAPSPVPVPAASVRPTWHSGESPADAIASVAPLNPAPAGRERLELAVAYLDLGDTVTARDLLNEVAAGHDEAARQEALQLLRDLG